MVMIKTDYRLSYCCFYCVLALQSSDPDWYTALTSVLTNEQAKSLQEVFNLAEQRKASLGENYFP